MSEMSEASDTMQAMTHAERTKPLVIPEGMDDIGGMGSCRDDAARLMERINASLKSVVTPKQARALIDLKGLELRDVSQRALLGPNTLTAWLTGRSPILPMRQLGRLELVLGFERSHLCPDRVHVLHLDEQRLGKEGCARHFAEVLPLLKRASMSIVCDENGQEAWAAGARIHVLALPQDAHCILVHQQRAGLMASGVRQQLQDIAWAEHGSTGRGRRSELVIPKSMVAALKKQVPTEGDQLSRQLADQFDAAARLVQIKAISGLGSLGGLVHLSPLARTARR